VEELFGGAQDSGLDLGVGEVWAHGLRIELEGGAAVLLVPVASSGKVDFLKPGLLLAGEVEDHVELALCPGF
jgi:hypothetical protein